MNIHSYVSAYITHRISLNFRKISKINWNFLSNPCDFLFWVNITKLLQVKITCLFFIFNILKNVMCILPTYKFELARLKLSAKMSKLLFLSKLGKISKNYQVAIFLECRHTLIDV